MGTDRDALAGEELRAWRTLLGMTQRELAAALGVTPNTVARWERGELRVARPAMVRAALTLLANRRKGKEDPG
jgi:transcriptional regulator with XRE-family HTH domain